MFPMPKFAANLSFLFTDVPFPERFARARDAGFRGVEYLFPYDWPVHDLSDWLRESGLVQVLFNLGPGDWESGERGLACLPQRQGEFAEWVERAVDYALVLECPRVHCLAGLRPPGVAEHLLEETYLANVRYAADRLACIGATLLLEPINSTVDMPGYWLDSVGKGMRLVQAVDRANVRLQYDCYHATIIGDDLQATLMTQLPWIGHVQIADAPGRHEPGSAGIDYPALFDLLDRAGYAGWIGCEYKPRHGTEAGLGWFAPYRAAQGN